MKYMRSIAVMLVFVLAASPALAAVCAISCASASVRANGFFGLQSCHEVAQNKDKSTSTNKHQSCVMGAACQFAQVISDDDALSKYVYADTTAALFSKLACSDKSVECPPPLKPPA